MSTRTIQQANELWNYQASFGEVREADAIVVCCSYDLRVCDFACELFKAGVADKLVFSGNTGNWTRHIWSEPEAQIFYKRAMSNGIDPSVILLELEATNFGENIQFTRALLPDARRVTLVSKPNSLLRVKLTADKQWPEVQAAVASPDVQFPDEVSNVVGILGVIDEMVGDIERIQRYPKLGYQASHDLPETILAAWNSLIAAGFDGHLMK